MKKILLRVVLVIVVLLVLVVVVGWLKIDSLAKMATQRGVTYATGTPTKVESMNVSLLSGSVGLKQMVVSNPQGFTASPDLLATGSFKLGVDVGSLFGPTVRVREFTLDGLELNIEQILGGSNVSTVIANLKRLSSPSQQPKQPSGKTVAVDRIVIRNVVARFYLPAQLAQRPIEVKLPEIQLNNVTSDNAGGVAISELTRRLLTAVLAAVAEKSQGLVPADVLGGFNKDVGELVSSAGSQAAQLVNQAKGEALGKLGQQATQAFGQPGQPVEENVRERMKGLLDRGK